MALIILRCLFLFVTAGFAISLLHSGVNSGNLPVDPSWVWFIVFGILSVAILIIIVDACVRRKRLDVISSVYFGMLVGLLLTYILSLTLVLFTSNTWAQSAIQLSMGVVLCYSCISLLLQTRNDFRFIIPYVEFVKEVKGLKPCILDTSVVIDGRIADVVETHLFDGQMIMPKFVISELQSIADSSDRLRRGRGRRGLDILNRLRSNTDIELVYYDHDLPEFAGLTVDLKLVALAKHLQGKLVTNDFNLNKVAKLQGVKVINLNEVANALKPVFLPGERFEVRVIRAGEEPGQGVGYLEDGTMVVVEAGREFVGQNIFIAVTSVLQTSAGRMVFGKAEGLAGHSVPDSARPRA
jgi:uncharacterized protein YacL